MDPFANLPEKTDPFAALPPLEERPSVPPILNPQSAIPDPAVQAQDTYDVAIATELPVGMVEGHYDHGAEEMQKLKANPIGLREQIERMDSVDWFQRTPFLGSVSGTIENADLVAAATRLKTGDYGSAKRKFSQEMMRIGGEVKAATGTEVPLGFTPERYEASVSDNQLRQADVTMLERYLIDQQERAVRGQTFASKVFDGASYLPSWMIEFALTGGIAKMGSSTAERIMTQTLKNYAETAAGRAVLKAAGWTGAQITRTTLGMTPRISEDILERRLNSLQLADGKVIEINPESWATSILKGYENQLIQVSTESMGAGIGKAGAWVTRRTIGKLPFAQGLYDGMKAAYLRLHPEEGALAKFTDQFFDAAKWDGLLEEMGEERMATILSALAETQNFTNQPDPTPLENLAAGISQDLKPGNLLAEVAVLSIPGAIKAAGRMVGPRAVQPSGKEIPHGQVQGQTPATPVTTTEPGAAPVPEPQGRPAPTANQPGSIWSEAVAAAEQEASLSTRIQIFQQLKKLSPADLKAKARELGVPTSKAAGGQLAVDVADAISERMTRDKPKFLTPESTPANLEPMTAEQGAGRQEQSPSPQRPGETIRVSPIAREANGDTYYDIPVEYRDVSQTAPDKLGMDVEVLPGGHVRISAARESPPLEGDVNVAVRKAVRDHFNGKKEAVYAERYGTGYWRLTNNAKEVQLAKRGELRGSRDWASGQSESGLSVNTDLSYSVNDFKYAYRVDGPVVGTGADGEPVLDVKKLTVRKSFGASQTKSLLESDQKLFDDLLSQDGWSRDLYSAAHTGVVILPSDKFAASFESSPRSQSAGTPAQVDPREALKQKHPGSLKLSEFRQLYGEGLAGGGKWWDTYINEGETHRDAYARLRDEYHTLQAQKMVGDWGLNKPAESPAEPVQPEPSPLEPPPYELTEPESRQIDRDAREAAVREQVNEALGGSPRDLAPGWDADPSYRGVGWIRGFLKGLHSMGYAHKMRRKDFVWWLRYIQQPRDKARTWSQYEPLWKIQEARTRYAHTLETAIFERLKPYLTMRKADRDMVRAVRVKADKNRAAGADISHLTPTQKTGYKALGGTFDWGAEEIIRLARQWGVPEKRINEFRGHIGSYFPHIWKGKWRVVAFSATNPKSAEDIAGASSWNLEAVTKQMQARHPGQRVTVFEKSKLPDDMYQDAPVWAVHQMIKQIIERVEQAGNASPSGYSPTQPDPRTVANLKQAATDIAKMRGFAAHFIGRKETAGWIENSDKPIIDYFTGLASWLAKMQAGISFPEALKNIDPHKTPELYVSATRDIKYWMGDQPHEAHLYRRLAYWSYLQWKLSGGIVNLVGQLQFGWPELGKYTKFPAVKLANANADYWGDLLEPAEKQFLDTMVDKGLIEATQAETLSSYGSSPFHRKMRTQLKQTAAVFDFIRTTELGIRKSLALALYRSGMNTLDETNLKRVAGIVNDAYGDFGKGNRPEAFRSVGTWATIFKTFQVHAFTQLKNRIKHGEVTPFVRSFLGFMLTTGAKGLPWAGLGTAIYWQIFHKDPEAEARKWAEAQAVEWGMDESVGSKAAGVVFRGLPSLVNVDLSQQAGMGDLVELPRSTQEFADYALEQLLGVGYDIPKQGLKVAEDIAKGNGRALEDAAPMWLRNPMAAIRQYRWGVTTRSGRPVEELATGEPMKFTPGEVWIKSLGLQPNRVTKEWSMKDYLTWVQDHMADLKTNWIERYSLALRNEDTQETDAIRSEIDRYNDKMDRHNTPEQKILFFKEILPVVRSRKKGLGAPEKLKGTAAEMAEAYGE